MSKRVIAIDGPAASGKSTIANRLSERLNVPYINTGNMYRAITWYALEQEVCLSPVDENGLKSALGTLDLDYTVNSEGKYDIQVNGEFPGALIRSPEVAAFVSQLAALPFVREWLLGKQRSMASLGMIVMEGRDIGTVIFPDAEFKFFLTASPTVRAQRRLAQDGETVDGATVESVAKEIAERDERDSKREVAPLRKAEDAELVDSSEMTIDEVLDAIVSRIKNENN